MGFGSDQLPGQEHENAANLTRLLRKEQEDDLANQEKALADRKAKDEDRAKELGEFQAKAEARERGQLHFGGDKTKGSDGGAIEELENDSTPKKTATPKNQPTPPAPSK